MMHERAMTMSIGPRAPSFCRVYKKVAIGLIVPSRVTSDHPEKVFETHLHMHLLMAMK